MPLMVLTMIGEQTVGIDFTNKTVTDIHTVGFEAFINAYGASQSDS